MFNYQILSEVREWVMLGAELYVCYILKKEFDFDADKYERQEQRKRKKKDPIPQEGLTTGEHK